MKRTCYETYISTKQSEPQAYPWFPCTYGYQERSFGSQASPRQRPQASDCVVTLGVSTLPFSRFQRLTQKKEYDQVFGHTAFKFGTAHFLVLAYFRADNAPGRLGLVASKKHLKCSVNRNRFKRLARESFRLHQAQLLGCDVIVMSRPQSLQCETLGQTLSDVWGKLERKRRKSTSQDGADQIAGQLPT
jgi:ribonuclease P protein component